MDETEHSENLVEEKLNRSPSEAGREIFRLARQHGVLRVELSENGYDLRIFAIGDSSGDD